MKKYNIILVVCLSIVLLFTAASRTSADTYSTPTLILSEVEAVQGQTFTTTLCVGNGSNIIDFQIKLLYDPGLVTLISAAENDDAGGSVVINADTEGEISVTYSRTSSNTNGEKPIADLTFTVADDAGVGSYDLLRVDPDALKKADRLENGHLIEVPLDCDFQQLTIHYAGDIDLNGAVEITDVTHLRRHLAQLETLTPYQLTFADAYYDGAVDITDAVYIQRKIANFDVLLGNRINIFFCDMRGNLYATKSVAYGGSLVNIPAVPHEDEYSEGEWSLSTNEYIEPNFTNLQNHLVVYAYYGQRVSEAMQYYKDILTTQVYSGNLPTNPANMVLATRIDYNAGYYASIYWTSSNNSTINAGNGIYAQPTYDSTVTLSARIVSYVNGVIDETSDISFVYQCPGVFKTPSLDEVEVWLNSFFEGGINYDLKLPCKLTNENLAATDPYEIRIAWTYSQGDIINQETTTITRGTVSKDIDLVATVTFNGEPVKRRNAATGDGKLYFDNVHVEPIYMAEVKAYIISQIAANTGISMTNNEQLWNEPNNYNATVRWISNNVEVATIENNRIAISNTTVSGTLLPLTAQVTYTAENENHDTVAVTFEIAYTVSVFTDNTKLVAGKNISQDLYDALREAIGIGGQDLTTAALRDNSFVYLDLSEHPDITDLRGLTYCSNLRVLNISGLHITSGINEIASLSKLEALIARDCGLNNLTDGGAPVLKTAINLKMVDLSHNNFTTLDSVFAEGVKYGKLMEVYLDHNSIQDISALTRAPALMVLTLSNNGLQSDDLNQIAQFPYLMYLSLANNDITNISALQELKYLEELRLQGNHITDVRPLKKMLDLKALYLGHNDIYQNIDFLNYLTELRVLYLNDNRISDITSLSSLNKLEAINVSNNQIVSLTCLEAYSGTLKEVFAENNKIARFDFVENMTGLRRLMLSGNESIYEEYLPTYLSGLTELESLTLSGKPIPDLSFLSQMPKLLRLDIANCDLPAYSIKSFSILTDDETGVQTLQIDEYVDNIGAIIGRKSTLKFLDISGNNMRYTADEVLDYLVANGQVNSGLSGIYFKNGNPTSFSSLYNLGKLVVLYADNVNKTINAASFTSLMTEMQYLSLENCGISDTLWMSKFPKIVYLDVANNPITAIDLGACISNGGKKHLEYLYMDTTADDCTFETAYRTFDENVLKELSLRNVHVVDMYHLPDMNRLRVLDLTNTGITNLQGTEPDFYDIQSVVRFNKLKTIYVSKIEADISPLLDMNSLTNVYAVATPADMMFHESNIHTLYYLCQKGVTCYLYNETDALNPTAAVEGGYILNEMEDITGTIKVAADNTFSDNNPYLTDTINDFDVSWTVSNNVNYEIVDHHLSVKSYQNIHDEDLTLTATITVYPDGSTASREFTIHTSILRAADDKFFDIQQESVGTSIEREKTFKYHLTVKKAAEEGFSNEVKPVCDTPVYSYTAEVAGAAVPYTNIITVVNEANHTYQVTPEAPFGSIVTVNVDIGHTINNSFVADTTKTLSMTVVARTVNCTFVSNGGTVTVDGTAVTSYNFIEGESFLDRVQATRTGWLFAGWYWDDPNDGSNSLVPFTLTQMPGDSITLYAEWTPNSYYIEFNANGGSGTMARQEHVFDQSKALSMNAFTKTNCAFLGWSRDANAKTATYSNGQSVTNLANEPNAVVTLYAVWESVTLNKTSMSLSRMPSGINISATSATLATVTTDAYSNATTLTASISGYTNAVGSISATISSGAGSVTWSSNNTSVATVNSNGTVTGIASGTAVITATTTNGAKATCTVNVTIGSTAITWQSSNTAVASVSSGAVTAVGRGDTTITASTANGASASCSVHVYEAYKAISITSTSTYGKVRCNDAERGLFLYNGSNGTSFTMTFITAGSVESGVLYQCKSNTTGFQIYISSAGKVCVKEYWKDNSSTVTNDYVLQPNTKYTVVVSATKDSPHNVTINVKDANGTSLQSKTQKVSTTGADGTSSATIGARSSAPTYGQYSSDAPNIQLISINFKGTQLLSGLTSVSFDAATSSIGANSFGSSTCRVTFTGTSVQWHYR